ncbi:MAG: hypothetical protein KC609_19260 [Myxococcales bacterium]|nr:hypothetical protein [Myxococcales bacterium]
MSADTSPPYRPRGGEQSYMAPFRMTGAHFSGYVISASNGALQAIVDRYLNAPLADTVYRALGDFVLFVDAPIDRLRSILPPDSEMGFNRETDVGLWFLVGAGHREGDLWVLERLAWFIPYLWVDVPVNVITGRETYGYPKQMGWFSRSGASDGPLLTVETYVLPTFSPDTPLQKLPILTLERQSNGLALVGQAFDDATDAIEALVKAIVGDDGTIIVPGIELVVHLLRYIVNREMPLVFLKQFRDVVDPRRACYQAVLESPMHVTAFHGGGLYLGDFALEITTYASHPIVADLGLVGTPTVTGTRVPIDVAFQLHFDFETELARLIEPRQ